ncbi:alpha/beta hydrolase [Desulfobacterium sp. N47]
MNFEGKINPELLPVFAHLLEEWNFDDIRFERKKIIEIGKKMPRLSYIDIVSASEHFITGPDGNSNLRLKIYQPKVREQILPGVLFIHGGGFIIGSPEVEEALCYRYAGEINCVVVSPDYRLAPENPFPAGLEDCYAALKWFSQSSSELKVDASRIAVPGGSAGGGLTASRATDLSGLPPAYIIVGELDPLRDETIDYVLRLSQAGVSTEFCLYPGCFHGFESFAPLAGISQRASKGYVQALKRALYK